MCCNSELRQPPQKMSGGGDLPESWEGTAVPLVAVETALDETPEEGGFQVPFLVVCVEGVRMPAW